MHDVQLDEATRHEECPDDAKGAAMFKISSGISNLTSNARRVFRKDEAYDRCDFKDAQEGIEKTEQGQEYDTEGLQMPDGVNPDLVRPEKIRKVDQYFQPECPCCNMSKRFTQAWLVAVGFTISFGIRCNVGVATVKMNSGKVPEFQWTPETIGFVDASFFWGYIVTRIPGGFLAAKFSPTKLFGTAIFLSSCLNLLLPAATTLSGKEGLGIPVICVRILQGLVEGVTYPSVHGIWRWWAPPLERSRLATLAYMGSYGGAVLGMPISGFLADNIGWPAPYYFYGCAGICWYMFWLWLSFEKPAKHPSISPREQLYIEKSIGDSKAKPPTISGTPWLSVFTCMPVWAIIVANFARSWTFYLLLITQPKYFKEVYGMNVAEGSTIAALPHLIMTIIVPLGGQLADFLRQSQILSTTNVRKIFNCGGFGGEALFLIGVAFARNEATAVACLIIAVGCSGFAISGFNVNHLDIAPRYASILMGISNGVGTFAGMICPITTEQITKDTKDNDDLILRWQTVFCIASGIHFFGVAFYALFASGELQDWAKAEPKEETMEMNNDFEKPNNGYAYGANPNVVTGGQEQQSFLQGETVDYSDGGSTQPSANPFTSGQNNPFRQ